MTKQQLVEQVNAIPLFRTVGAGIHESNAIYAEDGTMMNRDELKERWVDQPDYRAVTEIGSTEAIAYVSHRYKIVQFAEMYLPLLNNVGECTGKLIYRKGFAVLDIYPEQEDYKMGGDKIGIVAYNSVNATCGLNIGFTMMHNGYAMTLPRRVASFRKIHTGNVVQATQDYIGVVTQIKGAWTTIVEKFTRLEMDKDGLKDLCKAFDVGDRVENYMSKKLENGKKLNLWDFCMSVFQYLANHRYKSEVHKRKRLDKFVEKVFDYELVMNI